MLQLLFLTLMRLRKNMKIFLNNSVSDVNNYEEHGVSVVFVDVGNTKIELMHPYGKDSPIKNLIR